MYLPLVVTSPPHMKIIVPFTKGTTTHRREEGIALEFLDLLNQFYDDSEFEQFFANNMHTYQEVEVRFLKMTTELKPKGMQTFMVMDHR